MFNSVPSLRLSRRVPHAGYQISRTDVHDLCLAHGCCGIAVKFPQIALSYRRSYALSVSLDFHQLIRELNSVPGFHRFRACDALGLNLLSSLSVLRAQNSSPSAIEGFARHVYTHRGCGGNCGCRVTLRVACGPADRARRIMRLWFLDYTQTHRHVNTQTHNIFNGRKKTPPKRGNAFSCTQ
jgi:hypothetical protein